MADINMAAGNARSPKVAIDDDVMDYVSGGCGKCESLNSYKRFMLVAAILTGNMNGFKDAGPLMNAYISIFGKKADTSCTDDLPSPRAVMAVPPAYKNV